MTATRSQTSAVYMHAVSTQGALPRARAILTRRPLRGRSQKDGSDHIDAPSLFVPPSSHVFKNAVKLIYNTQQRVFTINIANILTRIKANPPPFYFFRKPQEFKMAAGWPDDGKSTVCVTATRRSHQKRFKSKKSRNGVGGLVSANGRGGPWCRSGEF